MPKFSTKSLDRLATCHQDLQTLFNEVIKHFDCTILEGYRNQEDQDRAYRDGKSKLRFPDGKHNKMPSNAVDVLPYPVPAWKNTVDFIYFGGQVMGIAAMLFYQGKITSKIRYGGDWSQDDLVSNDKFGDFVHFEIC